MRALMMTLGLSAVLAGSAPAQLYPVPNRQGFWAGLGLGAAFVGASCDGCDNDRTFGPGVYLQGGGTLTDKLLLGIEFAGWGMSEGGVDQVLGTAMVALFWYPSRSADFYLKFGAGGVAYERKSTTLSAENKTTETAAGISIGLGYDLYLGRSFSLVPFLNLYGSSAVERRVNGTEVLTGGDVRRDMVQFGLGLTFH